MLWQGTSRLCPNNSWLRSTIPHGAIPILTTRPVRCCPSSKSASPTCFVTPETKFTQATNGIIHENASILRLVHFMKTALAFFSLELLLPPFFALFFSISLLFLLVSSFCWYFQAIFIVFYELSLLYSISIQIHSFRFHPLFHSLIPVWLIFSHGLFRDIFLLFFASLFCGKNVAFCCILNKIRRIFFVFVFFLPFSY